MNFMILGMAAHALAKWFENQGWFGSFGLDY